MEIKMIDIGKIQPNPLQPRKDFDEKKLQELADSIKEGELLQPIIVRNNGGNYELVAGERRWRAFKQLNKSPIPAVIWDIKDNLQALEKSVIENWQREDLKDYEKRQVINELWNSGRYESIRELSRRTGINLASAQDYIEDEGYRQRVVTPPEVKHTTIRATQGLSDKVRDKTIELSDKAGIPARKLEEDIVPRLKKFPREEQQLDILNEFEKRDEQSKEVFDSIIRRKEEIAKGKRAPELIIVPDDKEMFVDDLESVFRKTYGYGITNIGELPKIHRDRAIKLALGHVVYWLKQLQQLSDGDIIKEILKKV